MSASLIRIDLQLPLLRPPRRQRGGALSVASVTDIARDPMVVLVGVLAVCCFAVAAYLDTSLLETMRATRNNVVRATKDSTRNAFNIQQAREMEGKEGALREVVARIARIDRNRYAIVHVMDQVAQGLGPNMWLTSLGSDAPDAETGNIGWVVTGYASSRQEVARFRDRLESSPFLTAVQPDSVFDERVNGIPLVRFQIEGLSDIKDPSFIDTETFKADATGAGAVTRPALGSPAGTPPGIGPSLAPTSPAGASVITPVAPAGSIPSIAPGTSAPAPAATTVVPTSGLNASGATPSAPRRLPPGFP